MSEHLSEAPLPDHMKINGQNQHGEIQRESWWCQLDRTAVERMVERRLFDLQGKIELTYQACRGQDHEIYG